MDGSWWLVVGNTTGVSDHHPGFVFFSDVGKIINYCVLASEKMKQSLLQYPIQDTFQG